MRLFCLLLVLTLTDVICAQQPYNGIESNLGNLFRLSNAKADLLAPRIFNGAKGGGKATTGIGAGAARGLGQG